MFIERCVIQWWCFIVLKTSDFLRKRKLRDVGKTSLKIVLLEFHRKFNDSCRLINDLLPKHTNISIQVSSQFIVVFDILFNCRPWFRTSGPHQYSALNEKFFIVKNCLILQFCVKATRLFIQSNLPSETATNTYIIIDIIQLQFCVNSSHKIIEPSNHKSIHIDIIGKFLPYLHEK